MRYFLLLSVLVFVTGTTIALYPHKVAELRFEERWYDFDVEAQPKLRFEERWHKFDTKKGTGTTRQTIIMVAVSTNLFWRSRSPT